MRINKQTDRIRVLNLILQRSIKMDWSTRNIFSECLSSLKPNNLLDACVAYDEDSETLVIKEGNTRVSLADGFYLIGFGKAVLGLASCLLTKIPGGKLKGGILSVPHGTSALPLHKECLDICDHSKVSVMEGARNNLPDEASETATRAILEMVDRLGPRDVVITVISGGGSSLLTAPVSGITLQEKLDVVKLISRSGADITELNTVR